MWWRSVWLCLVVLLAAAGAAAETVTVRVFNAKTPTNGVSTPVRNIGQSQHLIWLQFADSGGSCGAGSAQVWLEASYDGTTYFPLTGRLLQLDGAKSAQAVATGTYPRLRVNSANSQVNCSLTVWYSGSTDPAAFPQSLRHVQSGYIFASGAANSTTANPVVVNPNAEGRVVVYGFWTHNAGATQTGELFFSPDGTCTVISATVATLNMASGAAPAIWPAASVPYGYGAAGASLCFRLGGAGNATVYTVYRVE